MAIAPQHTIAKLDNLSMYPPHSKIFNYSITHALAQVNYIALSV